ncbi:MAG: transcription elongation factor GreA [Elusimicrobia bacterium]|nr:transcription elongation factor GreA [Elusimicrobiota bacterium]MDE2238221.1 transcription elongation factor GreA [Elusimicrobiota bacterium]MDE2426183.1 transcription elongation factor GreA [Elusimicrobiota bacterium]
MGDVFLTRAGYEKLLSELEPLKKQKGQLSQDIAEAREKGDLKENAEYHSAKEKLGEVMSRIAKIQDKLESAKLIDDLELPKGQVAIGCLVRLKDDEGEELSYTLVGEDESDPAEGRLSVYSPLAQGLLGKKVGETATVELPAGPRRFKILAANPA